MRTFRSGFAASSCGVVVAGSCVITSSLAGAAGDSYSGGQVTQTGGGASIPVDGVIGLDSNSGTAITTSGGSTVSLGSSSGLLPGDQLVVGTPSESASGEMYAETEAGFLNGIGETAKVLPLYIGVFHGSKKVGGILEHPITIKISDPSITPGELVFVDVNGTWQFYPTQVTDGSLSISIDTDPQILLVSVKQITIRIGKVGTVVASAQELLNSHGAKLKVDGIFGPLTRKAVLAFQSKNHLATDGVVGPATWHALKK